MFLISALSIPYRSVVRIASPLVPEYWKHRNFTEMQAIYQKVSSVCLFIGMSFFLVIWINIDFLFTFLKPEFKIGIWIFLYLMIGRLIDMYFGLNGAIFTTSKKYKYDLIFTVILLFLVYGLKLHFIPWWGTIGAASSTAVALIVYNLGRIIIVYRAYKIHPFTKQQFAVIGLGLITIAICYFARRMITNQYICLISNLFILLVTFFLPIYIFKLENESITYLKKVTSIVKAKLSK
jgi:O-antigen/teichoic acid export membrane protein